MTRANFHRITAIAPFVCSLLALVLVVAVLISGWERHLADEGAAAHLFQLLIAAQLPLIGLFIASAAPGHRRGALRMLAGHCAALCLPLGLAAAAGR
jgi:hypothetical protein